MNNKGFAITTLIYGLAIMGTLLIIIIMATLSSTRNNIKELATTVEDELLAYNNGNLSYRATESGDKTYYFNPGAGQEGYYRIELWAPQGVASGGLCNGGLGSYTTGIIYLEKGQSLNIHVGKCGGWSYVTTESDSASNPKPFSSNVIMRAGSGGTMSTYHGGTLCSYFNDLKKFTVQDINSNNTSSDNNCHYKQMSSIGVNEVGQPSYIVGYPAPNMSAYVSRNSKKYSFYDGLMLPGVNAGVGKAIIEKIPTATNYTFSSSINGGYWTNAYEISVSLSGNTSKYTDNQCMLYYRFGDTIHNFYIKRGGTNSGVNSTLQSYTNKMDISDVSLLCTQKDKDYSDLIFTIRIKNGRYKAGTSSNSNTYTEIYHGEYNPTDPSGVKLSMFQPDAVVDQPKHGRYYIVPAYLPYYAISAPVNEDNSFDPVTLTPLAGENRQRWIIDMLSNADNSYKLYDNIQNTSGVPEFRIMESSRYKSLDIKKDENIFGNLVSAQYQFNTLSKSNPQVWKLIPNKDGTYSFETIISSGGTDETGYVTYGLPDASLRSAFADLHEDSIYIGKKEGLPKQNQKFKLYALDMSTMDS